MLNDLTKQAYDIIQNENLKIYNEFESLTKSNRIEECISLAISKNESSACIFCKKYDSRINYKKLLTEPIGNYILDTLKKKYPDFKITHYEADGYYYSIDICWDDKHDDCKCIIL